MKELSDIIRGLPYFSDLAEDLIEAVAEGSSLVELEEGAVIIEEGSDSEEMYVVVDGLLVVSKMTGDKQVELVRLGPGEVVGEIALLDDAPRTATVAAADPSHVIKVPVEAFEDLLRDSNVVRRMFRTVTSRLRDIEDTLRHEERMAALGRMAAQLMHELNNPAAAVSRSTEELIRLYSALGDEAEAIAASQVSGDALPRPEPAGGLTSLDRAEAEDAVAAWLAESGVGEPWEITPSLVDLGWTPQLLEQATSAVEDSLRVHLLRWIGLRATAEQVIGEIAIGTRRISELVRVVKGYSFLDQAPVQEIDPMSGINDTLILMKHKLRDIDVVLDVDEDLHRVEAPGRDLNQVWTNLIDNAADAMEGSGTLTISAHNVGDHVEIAVSDTGSGIPPDVAERIFDPFYTTKEPGKGTGLGLHTVQSIVRRTGGDILLDSSPEGTTFKVRIPIVA